MYTLYAWRGRKQQVQASRIFYYFFKMIKMDKERGEKMEKREKVGRLPS